MLPPSAVDGQPRYRIRVFGEQPELEIELLNEVAHWAIQMTREDRLRHLQGSTPRNEEIETG